MHAELETLFGDNEVDPYVKTPVSAQEASGSVLTPWLTSLGLPQTDRHAKVTKLGLG